ncbi:MAG: PAS domain S-box protein [Deltaproteobacteria bacterium]|nr:PAS domain S-box protein [Deltaproteobacteria bacterium]
MHEEPALVLEGELKKFQVLYELAVAMTGERSLEENLQLVVDRSRDLLGADTSYIALREEAAGDVYMHTLSGIRTEAFRMMRLPYGKGLGGLVAKTRQGLIVEDYFGERKIRHVVDRIVADEGVVSGMAVPIQMGSRNLGVLYVFNRSKTSFSQADLDTLSLIGNLAAVEISRKRAEDSVRRSREELETKVKERTSELEKANTLLAQEVLERKRSETALVAAEQKYRSIFENAMEGMFQSTPSGSFISANPALARMYGYDSPEELMTEITDIGAQLYVDPRRREDFIRLLREKGAVQGFENMVFRRDGTIAVTSLNARLVPDKEGNIPYFEGTVEDITEQKRAEEALMESEKRYRTLVENLPIGIYRVTPGEKGLFLMANRAFLSMFGYEKEEEIKGVHVSDIYMHPEERKGFSDELLARRSFTMSDRYLKRKDGTPLWGTVTARVAYDEGTGEPAFFDCAIEDITERRRTEERLQEAERRYRDLFENVSDFIYFHDMEGVFLESNLAFRRAYGLREEELGRIHVKDMMPPENRGFYEDYMKRVLECGADEGLLKVVTRRGTDLVMEYKNSLVRDPEGNPVGVRGSARDVTERIRSEKEKKRLQAQLMSAQRIEAIGTLAGGIAHNFNNLLMGIQGNATLARLEVTASSPIHQKLESIERLVKSGAKLTSQLLGYAREGRYEVRPISLNQLVSETSHTFAQARKDIRVHLDLEESLSGIEADQGQIEQVLLNLLVNAADAMPAGGEVFLRTRNVTHREMTEKPYRPKEGKYAILEVSDTGVGMDGKTMERIFEPFFTTKAMGKGTGLGLASVYGMVKGHGGYIDVHTQRGRGSTFQVYLPASERKIFEERELPGGILKGSGRILLVDDEEMIIEVGRGMLEKLGYQVVVANSGMEAVRLYRKNGVGIDLVILDVVMPGMGGGETYEQLRRINPAVRVLLSSGYSLDGHAKDLLDRGCHGFIQKPFNLQCLSEEVQRIMR